MFSDAGIEALYVKESWASADRVWGKYQLFHPRVSYLRHRDTRRALAERDTTFLTVPFRNQFFPRMDDLRDVDARVIETMAFGAETMNGLMERFAPEHQEFFHVAVPEGDSLFQLVQTARQSLLRARPSGSHSRDPGLMYTAYNAVRLLGLSYRVLLIDSDPSVQRSLEHAGHVREWFQGCLRFSLSGETRHPVLTRRWETGAGVSVYGSGTSPFESRVKALDAEGKVKYDSILMKLFRGDGNWLSHINDHGALSFYVASERDADALGRYIRRAVRPLNRPLEKWDHKPAKGDADNGSSARFSVRKFNLRIPVARSPIPGHRTPGPLEERLLVEVQIKTLATWELEHSDPDVDHEALKRRQYLGVHHLWYPRKIYEPLWHEIHA